MQIKMRMFMLFFAVLAVAGVGHAQTGHGAQLTITPYGFGASTNVYAAPCNVSVIGTPVQGGVVGTPSSTGGGCSSVGQMNLIGNIPAGNNSYSDTTQVAGANVVYQFVSVCPSAGCTNMTAGNSPPSVQIAVTLPKVSTPPVAPIVPGVAAVTGFN